MLNIEQKLDLIIEALNEIKSALAKNDQASQSRQQSPRPMLRMENPKSSLMERAETLLLRIYIHCPDYRDNVTHVLNNNELTFISKHIRQLWNVACSILSNDGLFLPADCLIEQIYKEYKSKGWDTKDVSFIFELTESSVNELLNPKPYIADAVLALEQVAWEKYGQYCCERLQSLEPGTQGHEYYKQEWLKCRKECQKIKHQRLIHRGLNQEI